MQVNEPILPSPVRLRISRDGAYGEVNVTWGVTLLNASFDDLGSTAGVETIAHGKAALPTWWCQLTYWVCSMVGWSDRHTVYPHNYPPFSPFLLSSSLPPSPLVSFLPPPSLFPSFPFCLPFSPSPPYLPLPLPPSFFLDPSPLFSPSIFSLHLTSSPPSSPSIPLLPSSPGSSTADIQLTILPDDIPEVNELFTVQLLSIVPANQRIRTELVSTVAVAIATACTKRMLANLFLGSTFELIRIPYGHMSARPLEDRICFIFPLD